MALEIGDQELPGVTDPEALARGFSDAWTRRHGGGARVKMNLRCYELTGVEDLPLPVGRPRWAEAGDQKLLTDWVMAFSVEAVGSMDAEVAREMTLRKIRNRELRVWGKDGRIASMAAGLRPTGSGITLNLVYTPKEMRRKGFATALVADLSRIYLEEGYRFCTLFTDLDFPASSNVYQKIGYRPVADFLEIGFDRHEAKGN